MSDEPVDERMNGVNVIRDGNCNCREESNEACDCWDWDDIRDCAIKGDFDSIPAEILIKYCENLKLIYEWYQCHQQPETVHSK